MNHSIRQFFVAFSLAFALAIPASANEALSFVRLEDDAALEVAITRFQRSDGITVDLFGVVHVADQAYFEAVDERLAGYETVLFELVGDPQPDDPSDSGAGKAAAETAPEPKPGIFLSLAGGLQDGMRAALGLAHQMEHIDYGRPNMVHADLTAEEFAASMRERGESMLQPVLRAWAFSMTPAGRELAAQQQFDLLQILWADDRQLALKRAMAGQLAQEEMMRGLLSGREGSTLIDVRNTRALEVLRFELDKGKRELAIFYGAGHMADMAQRLEADHGFRHVGTEWLMAWDLSGG